MRPSSEETQLKRVKGLIFIKNAFPNTPLFNEISSADKERIKLNTKIKIILNNKCAFLYCKTAINLDKNKKPIIISQTKSPKSPPKTFSNKSA